MKMLRPTALVLALAASTLALSATVDPPERIANLSYVEGRLEFAGTREPLRSALPDRPLLSGDRFVTKRDGRAELSLGTAAIRLDEATELSIVDLDAAAVRVQLAAGTVSVSLDDLLETETFEIVTPNTTISLREPGEFRVEVPGDDATIVTVHGGIATVETADGPVDVADGQRVQLTERDAFATLAAARPADDFDYWVQDREAGLADAQASSEDMRDSAGYGELDHYGEWTDEPGYGRVWMPAYGYAGWEPFRYGYWERVGYNGWAWIDPSPWGALTYYQGRWAYLDQRNRWCWVPERRDHRRHVAGNTAPFGHPRGNPRPRADDGKRYRAVATTLGAPRFNDIERRPAPKPNAHSGERTRAATTMRSSSVSAARNQARWGAATQTHPAFGTHKLP